MPFLLLAVAAAAAIYWGAPSLLTSDHGNGAGRPDATSAQAGGPAAPHADLGAATSDGCQPGLAANAPICSSPPLVKIMPLGDSITAGSDKTDPDGYRQNLLELLPGYPIDFVGTYSSGDSRLADKSTQADSGACIRADPCNSASMYPLTEGWIREAQPDIVLLQGGMNDFCCGRQDEDPKIVEDSMRDWVQLIFTTKPDVQIVVTGLPDYHLEYKNWIPQFVAEQAAAGRKIHYVGYDGISTVDTVNRAAA